MDHPLNRRRSDLATVDPVPRALVCDDDPDYRAYIAALVRRHGFEVTKCDDGTNALETLRDHAFDLLVVDYEMPRMDGLTLIGQVRDLPQHSEIYAVMLTGHEDVETKLSALRLGYDDFLSKSETELEIAAKLTAARRLVTRQRRMDASVRELYGLATRDELTGLFNRRFLFAEIERRLREAAPVNLVLFDLDGFKRINDTYGHLAGDRILSDLGSLFMRRTRHDDLVGRFGGDEFVMLIGDALPAEVAVIAERVVTDLKAAQWIFAGDTVTASASIGFACSPLIDEPTVSKLLAACDRDLYKNKWIRKHPDVDPGLYEYDRPREATVVELPNLADELHEVQAKQGQSESEK
jgi:two-component system, cell cycle response regulator